jgi:hypothetical protein
VNRKDLCVKACKGLLSEDLEFLLSTGRNLCDEIKYLEELQAGLEIGREAYLQDIVDKRNRGVLN